MSFKSSKEKFPYMFTYPKYITSIICLKILFSSYCKDIYDELLIIMNLNLMI